MMELNIEGVIGYDILPNKVRGFLRDSSGEDVLLLINSPGGDAYDAVAIHSILKEYPGSVTARVQGLAASGASLLIMAADKIEMCVGSLLMIHEPSADFLGYRGTADTHRRVADALDVTTAAVAKIYVNRSGQREKQVLNWMRDETWFGPDDAVSSGFADEIFDDASEVEPFPANYAAVFSNTPANLAQLCHVKGWDKLRKEMKMPQAKTKSKQGEAPQLKSLAPQAQTTVQGERDRVSELFTMARQPLSSGVVDDSRLDGWIREGVTVEQAASWVMSATAANDGGTIGRRLDGHEDRTPYTTGMSYDQGSGLVEKVADGFLARLDKTHKPTLGREFAGVSMVDIADVVLQADGRRPPMFGGRSSKVEMAMGTSDFPLILGSAMNRLMLNNYEAAASGIKALSREVGVSDFRTRHSLKLSTGPELEKVLEGGEYTSGSLSEGDETFAAETYGKILALTRQAVVNDDLGAFDNMARIMGQGAAQTEAKLFAGILTKNSGSGPTMADGDTLFHTNHGNKAPTGTDLSVTALGAAQVAMMRQSGLAGEVIKVIPMFLLVPPELKVIAEQLLTAITASDTASVNPFAGQLTLIVDPYLTDPKRWYVTSTPGNPDALQHAYLDGQAGPEIFTQEGFEIDAVQFKCRLDFGAGFVDHRAWYTNAGA